MDGREGKVIDVRVENRMEEIKKRIEEKNRRKKERRYNV